jgi:hypothetical protein
MKFNIWDYALNAYTVLVTALIGAIAFMVRKVFTNEKQIEVLEARLSDMSNNIERDIKDLKLDIKDLATQLRNK